MDLKRRDDDSVYDLVTQLVTHVLRKNRIESVNLYSPPRSDIKIIKKLRSRAFEILLNKGNGAYDQDACAFTSMQENMTKPEVDPIVEILKHIFVLKVSHRRVSEAKQLEDSIDELFSQGSDIETAVDPVLWLLIELKNFRTDIEPVLDVFHYGKPNPHLPEVVTPASGVPMFQTYPIESFIVPEKFQVMLGIRTTYVKQDTSVNPVSRVSFEDSQCVSKDILGIETIRCHFRYNNNAIEMVPCVSSCTENTPKLFSSTFLTHTMHVEVEQISKLYFPTQRFMSNTTLSYEWIKSLENQKESQNNLRAWSSNNFNHNITNQSEHNSNDIKLLWREMRPSSDPVSKLRTWETFGAPESSKQSLFFTDRSETTLHLARIRQACILSLLPKKVVDSVPLMRQISPKDFLSDMKLLLLGIDSNSFKSDNVTGFKLEGSITVHGISPETLTIACQEAISWGNSFKSLSYLVTPDPQTGKLQQDGLIFKAMCAGVKEFLLYYRMALQRTLKRYESQGLLGLFKKVRPLARLIVEVAKLCDCNKHGQCNLGGGSGILTHVYKEVTRITNPKVALVFYSILKSCCEVYFRMLQSWLFEGTCEDVYGEFMIQVRSQYLRKRGRKFWTEGFAIDTESVPGFLSELSESILQCGKTLRLLKICSPKNPVCNVSITAQPEVRVCLSVSMLREQLLRCQEYERRGEAALGPIVSLLSAIQDQKIAEREKADLVIRAQQETLSRINKQREELVAKTAQNKRALLQVLKNQAEESALFKEREKELEMQADKLLLEKFNREQEEMQAQRKAEREHLISYYDKLAAEVERNRLRSDWRKARMSHFEKRAEFLESAKRFDRTISESIATPSSDTIDIEQSKDTRAVSSGMDISVSEAVSSRDKIRDENSNFTANEVSGVTAATDVSNCIGSEEDLSPTEIISMDIDIPSYEDREFASDQDALSDEKVTTNEDALSTVDTRNVHSPRESLPLNYIYKKNNERSNLQDFLRDEAMKNIRSMMKRTRPNPIAFDTRLNNNFEADGRIIGTIDRPKSLAIEKIDNMTAAQANKLKVLLQEYGMTPNNNEFDTIFTDGRSISECTNINGNNQVSLNATNEQDTTGTVRENANNNVFLTLDVKLPEETAIVVGGSTNNGERLNRTNTNNKAQEPLLSNTRQHNVVDTPMSCTTDSFATLSTHTPLSQIQNSDDVFASNANQETSLSDTAKSIAGETCFESPTSNFLKLPNPFDASPDHARPAAPRSSLTMRDVEMLDHTSLQVYLEKSVIAPLQIQSRLINNAIIKFLVNEHNMLSHLHSLRSYFFLLNGEFAKSLTDSLYRRLDEISAPIELFNSAILTSLLEKALMNSFNSNYVNSELLSLSAIDKPYQLYISDPNVLECLSLNYKISWPLNIILDDTMMLQYSKVFKFLIMTGRMSWVLQEDFNIMKMERNAVISEQYHKLQLYRHSMTQFMNALHNYLTCSVLHASWSEFEKDLQNSRTIDQIYLSHMNYIKRILSRCMLNARGEKMRVCLINIFKIILKYHNRLRSQVWIVGSTGRYNHPNFKSLEQMYQSFYEWRTYMAHVAHKLAISGYQPHLTHFLNALNINHMYDLTIKRQ